MVKRLMVFIHVRVRQNVTFDTPSSIVHIYIYDVAYLIPNSVRTAAVRSSASLWKAHIVMSNT
jgi:hypothetical protein